MVSANLTALPGFRLTPSLTAKNGLCRIQPMPNFQMQQATPSKKGTYLKQQCSRNSNKNDRHLLLARNVFSQHDQELAQCEP